MSRWKAAGIHFTLSLIVATALIVVMLLLWYPPPYFTLMGGAMLVVLIAGCDVVLGPLITLIIFRSGKKGLTFDLGTIAALQAIAMTYGLYTMFEARPVFTVFAVDRFEVVAANEIRPEELAKASRPEFASLSMAGPRVVGAMLPRDPKEQLDIAVSAMSGAGDIKTRPRLYVPYNWIAADAVRKSKPLDSLEKKHPGASAEIASKVATRAEGGQLAYVPIVGRFASMSAIVDARSGRIETIVDVDPW
jgi:hypothetical protein